MRCKGDEWKRLRSRWPWHTTHFSDIHAERRQHHPRPIIEQQWNGEVNSSMLINVLFTNIYIQMHAGTQARTHCVIYRSTWEVASDEIMSATVCLLYNPHLPQLDVLRGMFGVLEIVGADFMFVFVSSAGWHWAVHMLLSHLPWITRNPLIHSCFPQIHKAKLFVISGKQGWQCAHVIRVNNNYLRYRWRIKGSF